MRNGSLGEFGRGLRPVEWVLGVYLAATALLMVYGAPRIPDVAIRIAIHVAGIAAIVAFARFGERLPWSLAVLRRFYPLVLGPIFYIEIAVLNDAVWGERYFDTMVVAWERALFGVDTSQVFARVWPWTWWSELLHFGYFSYYFIPATLFVALAVTRRWERLEEYLTAIAFTFASCQIWFVLMPVTGPYHYFGPLDPPAAGSVFPVITNAIVSAGSSLGTAFPSSHVAVSTCVLACAWISTRWVRWVLAVLVVLLTTGTVYGGFHYLIDALAGIVWGLATCAFAIGLHRRLQRARRADIEAEVTR